MCQSHQQNHLSLSDALYQEAAADAFTATELNIAR
jgi:hypothetical protein